MNHEEHSGHEHRHEPGCGHETVTHGDHEDFVHDGHRHAAHGNHWDEHGAPMAGADYGASDAVGVSRDDSGAAASTWSAGAVDRPETPDEVGGS